jgi:ketosteroid isomerase-like protein
MTPLDALLNAYTGLTPATLEALVTCYAPDAHFKDPFNDVSGHAGIRAIFTHMFANTANPRFDIISAQGDGTTAFVIWVFHCGVAGRQLAVHGASHLRFDEQGRVCEHRDYWDPAEEMWQHLPLLGKPVAWLRRRFRVDA